MVVLVESLNDQCRSNVGGFRCAVRPRHPMWLNRSSDCTDASCGLRPPGFENPGYPVLSVNLRTTRHSSGRYNRQTGLLICCPVSSSIRGAATEVPVHNLEQPSVVAANLIQTLSWKDRDARKIVTAEPGVMEQVLLRILPLIGADRILERYIEPSR